MEELEELLLEDGLELEEALLEEALLEEELLEDEPLELEEPVEELEESLELDVPVEELEESLDVEDELVSPKEDELFSSSEELVTKWRLQADNNPLNPISNIAVLMLLFINEPS